MRQFLSDEAATKANKWQGKNLTRWRDAAFDGLFHEAERELDPVKRAALFIAMNDLVIRDVVTIPVVYRPFAAAMSNRLRATLSGWDSNLWALADWYRED
jgi:peptide/nickel transport system substrate-binding protein